MGEQVGGHTGVADEAAVRPAVAEPEHGAGMGDHLPDRLVVMVDVAGERGEEQRPAVALQQPVEHDLLGPSALALGGGGHAVLGRGLVVGRVAQPEDLVPA